MFPVQLRMVSSKCGHWSSATGVAPPGSAGTNILLARPPNRARKHSSVIKPADECRSFCGVEFVRPPTTAPYGTVAVFKDLYGNLWDLIGPGGERTQNPDPMEDGRG